MKQTNQNYRLLTPFSGGFLLPSSWTFWSFLPHSAATRFPWQCVIMT